MRHHQRSSRDDRLQSSRRAQVRPHECTSGRTRWLARSHNGAQSISEHPSHSRPDGLHAGLDCRVCKSRASVLHTNADCRGATAKLWRRLTVSIDRERSGILFCTALCRVQQPTTTTTLVPNQRRRDRPSSCSFIGGSLHAISIMMSILHESHIRLIQELSSSRA